MNNPTLLRRLLRSTKLQDENLRRRAAVVNVLLASTLIVLTFAFITILISYFTGTDHNAPGSRLAGIFEAWALSAALYFALRKGKYFIAAYGAVGVYIALAIALAVHWSINLPPVSLMLCIAIVLAGIALGARFSLYAALVSAVLLFVIQLEIVHGSIHPITSWANYTTPHLIDVAVYYLVFIILGVSSWLFNRQTDKALHDALRAEVALEREKQKLEVELAARTRDLEAAHLEKMEQLYHFAELGQFSTSLLHDLANHMSTLSIDIEGLAEQHRHSQLQLRIKRRIQYIDNMVRWAYENINGNVQAKDFSVKREANEVLKILQYNARRAHVQLHVETDAEVHLYGDPNRFRQLVANLVSNAIEAYESSSIKDNREVGVAISQGKDDTVIVAVYDHGPGIPKDTLSKIFQPFYSTKYDGMGVGLFVVQQIAEEYFRGKIKVTSNAQETRFTATLTGAARDE